MTREQLMVYEFHRAMGLPVGDIGEPAIAHRDLRLKMIREEVRELKEAMELGDLVGTADALADIKYLVEGAAVQMGIDLGPVFDEVHRSNMRKVGGPVREDGKILKPPGWKPPDVRRVLAEQVETVRKWRGK